ncbi:MAG: hypothetical protein C5B52_01665 [Bacteroidetes bacterium]|nr:MAG: hypothetical protein C5B52_01665 [Bacteroidota bacterium]
MKKLILVLTLLSFIQFTFAQKQKLGFNLVIGESYTLSQQSRTKITQQINGQKINTDMTVGCRNIFIVTGLKDSIYSMSVLYKELSFTVKSPNGEKTFISEGKDTNDVVSTILSSMKDKPFNIRMTKAGKIIEVQNLDNIFSHLFDRFPQIDSIKKAQLKAQLMQSYGEKAFKGSFEMITAIYANVPVSPGNTWTTKTKLASGMDADVVTTYEYKEKADNYNLIKGSGNLLTIDHDKYMMVNGMPIKYSIKGSVNTSIKVDNKTGWVVESAMTEKLSGTAEIKDNPKIPGGLTIPMSIDIETNFGSN